MVCKKKKKKKKKGTVTNHNTESYRKIHAGNIVAWAPHTHTHTHTYTRTRVLKQNAINDNWRLWCGTIASRHLVGRWFRDYHMCRLVFLCFFPRPRCFQIRGKRRWLRSSRWRLEFVLERWKSCQANFKNDKNKAFVINSNKRLFTQLFR